MGNLSSQAGNELKQLPLMLGKLLGGIMTVVGFGAAVWLVTRSTGKGEDAVMLSLLAGVVGIVLFVLSGRKLAGRSAATGTQPSKVDKKRTSILAWTLLLLFATIFVLGVMFFLR